MQGAPGKEVFLNIYAKGILSIIAFMHRVNLDLLESKETLVFLERKVTEDPKAHLVHQGRQETKDCLEAKVW